MKKNKYENTEIVKGILAREFQALGEIKACMVIKLLDLKDKKDREYLIEQIEDVKKIFEDALKELKGE